MKYLQKIFRHPAQWGPRTRGRCLEQMKEPRSQHGTAGYETSKRKSWGSTRGFQAMRSLLELKLESESESAGTRESSNSRIVLALGLESTWNCNSSIKNIIFCVQRRPLRHTHTHYRQVSQFCLDSKAYSDVNSVPKPPNMVNYVQLGEGSSGNTDTL
jgi:hypothetical protein